MSDVATEQDWLAEVDATLRGKPFDRLRTHTEDGFDLEPLYTAANSPSGATSAPGRRGNWDVRTMHRHPDPVVTNQAIVADLERGASSVIVRLDRQRRHYGRPADPLESSAVLDRGLAVGWLADLDQILDGVRLDLATVAYDAGWAAGGVGLAHLALGDERGLDRSAVLGSLGIDPLAAWSRAAGGPRRPGEALDRLVSDIVPAVVAGWPQVRPVAIDTSVYSSAGATDSEELALLLASAVEWARACERAGVDVATVLGRVEARLTVGADVFAGVAKLRAARRLWDALLGACGVDESARALHLQALSAPRMFTRYDPWVNLLRGTAACFAAGVGGADGMTVLPFSDARGLADAFARRLARNTQIVLAEESLLGRVADPGAGSWFIESRSEALAAAAWAKFNTIESSGGLLAVIESGELATQLVDQAANRAEEIDDRRRSLTGLTEFPNLDEQTVEVADPDVDRLRTTRAAAIEGRSGFADPDGDVATVIAEIRGGAALPAAGDGSERGAALPARHLGDDVDALRSAAEEHRNVSGAWPQVFLANLGPLAEHAARTTFVTNLLAVGGIEGIGPEGPIAHSELIEAFRRAATTVACLCSSDDRCEAEGASVAAALRDAGATVVLVAGTVDVDGADDHLALGIDVVDALTRLHVALGVNP